MNSPHNQMRLYSRQGERLYLNRRERAEFIEAARQQNPQKRLLCLMLFHTGCRLSEALNLRLVDVQASEGIVAIASLKKRNSHHVREVPIPTAFLHDLEATYSMRNPHSRIWHINRSTGWRWITAIMEQAGITGIHATPKGLRHSFGFYCAYCNIAITLCQKWMGHADIKTTAIYYQIVGSDERDMARRMWVR